MPTTTTPEQRDQVRAFIRTRLEADPSLSGEKLRKECNDRFGLSIPTANFHVTFWKPVRVALGLHKPRSGNRPAAATAPASSVRSAAPVNRIAAAVDDAPAPSAASSPNGNGRIVADECNAREMAQEIRSLRGTYEGDEFVRLECEDGQWRLTANLLFDDSVAALKVLAGLAGR